MKLGVITDGISRDFEHALSVCKEFDLDYAELQFVWDKEIGDHSKSEIALMKKLLDGHGMSVACISRHIFTGKTLQMSTKTTDSTYQSELDALRRCISVSKELNSPYVRIFSGRKEMILFGRNGAEKWNVANGAWDALAPLIEPAVRIAEESDATIVVETGNGTMLNSSWTARKLLDEFSSEHLKLLWDPANNCYANEEMYPDGYDLIKGKYLAHIQLKDVRADIPKATLEVCEFGKGQLADQWEPLADALRADGYDGVVSYESVFHNGNGDFEEGFRSSIGRFKEVFA